MRLSLVPTIQEFDALSEFAKVERRQPLDAARFLIAEGLARRGLIPAPRVDPIDGQADLVMRPRVQTTTSTAPVASAAPAKGATDGNA
jgi:hypothetical protein